jgi:thiamine-monophosphate kinase
MSPRLGEDDLIACYFAPLAGPAGLGLRDDAALMRPPPG